MKIILAFIVSLSFSSVLFAKAPVKHSLGSVLYTSCKFCHGFKGEKIYNKEIPAINNLDKEALISILNLYKKGELDTYGYGGIMKMQMTNIPVKLIPILAKYIKDIK